MWREALSVVKLAASDKVSRRVDSRRSGVNGGRWMKGTGDLERPSDRRSSIHSSAPKAKPQYASTTVRSRGDGGSRPIVAIRRSTALDPFQSTDLWALEWIESRRIADRADPTATRPPGPVVY